MFLEKVIHAILELLLGLNFLVVALAWNYLQSPTFVEALMRINQNFIAENATVVKFLTFFDERKSNFQFNPSVQVQ